MTCCHLKPSNQIRFRKHFFTTMLKKICYFSCLQAIDAKTVAMPTRFLTINLNVDNNKFNMMRFCFNTCRRLYLFTEIQSKNIFSCSVVGLIHKYFIWKKFLCGKLWNESIFVQKVDLRRYIRNFYYHQGNLTLTLYNRNVWLYMTINR